jgi:CheY-like chemotaxis protein
MLRVLVVAQRLLAPQLQNAGYDVAFAQDALEAAEAVLEEPPDLMICDVAMPYMNGLEFIALLRADSTLPRFPIVVASAHPHLKKPVAALGADYLVKPFRADTLLDLVALRLSQSVGLAAAVNAARAQLHAA